MPNDDYTAGMPPRTATASVEGRLVSYLQWGDGAPDIVLVHGLTSSARTWWRLGPDLARLGCRVSAIDLPGHGHSDAPADYAFATTARTLDAWMSALALPSPVVVGHSWGGAICLVHATLPGTSSPASRVVLLDPLLRAPQGVGLRYREGMRAVCGRPRSELQPTLRDVNPAWDDGDVFWKAEALELTRPSAVDGVFDDNPTLELVALLECVVAPWAIVAADVSRGSIIFEGMDAELQAIASANRGAFVRLPGLAHDIYREDYAATWAALLKALEVTA